MDERQMEGVMRTFAGGEADVLVCTTIIESGWTSRTPTRS